MELQPRQLVELLESYRVIIERHHQLFYEHHISQAMRQEIARIVLESELPKAKELIPEVVRKQYSNGKDYISELEIMCKDLVRGL